MPALTDTLRLRAERSPDASAVLAPGRESLSAAGLVDAVDAMAARLRELGLGPGDRIALRLRNGPETAVAFLGVASVATAAPLNPALRAVELGSMLSALGARALIVDPEPDAAVEETAAQHGVPLLRLQPRPDREAGLFRLEPELRDGLEPRLAVRQSRHDVALLLPTSGTTSRPKWVPQSHASLLASIDAIGRTLALSEDDRCLNVMPQFHIHGLVAGVLAPLCTGGSVVCAPPFEARRFLAWAAEGRPSWYTSSPTIHRLVLAVQRKSRALERPLRFARSAAAALPRSLAIDLERALAAPVVEAYGMTEAAQICSNPLDARPRVPGSVGLPAGPVVAVCTPDGRPVATGETGEVAIRGPSVFRGYEDPTEANATTFVDGWFRTGDQGFFDANGYLFLTGRLKELVNVGGEKIAPREVEEVLLAHSDVAEAAAFPIPDPLLGERVGAVVVLQTRAAVEDSALRSFARRQLAAFKMPDPILVVDEIPKSPTGKVQRGRLAGMLGLVPGAKRN